MVGDSGIVRISPLVRRLTAPNPGPLTGAGTNTYIIGEQHLAVLDPGPAISSHIAAIVDACAGRLKTIFVTHTHPDHSPGTKQLAEQTGATVIGKPLLPDDGHQDVTFNADIVPRDNQVFSVPEYSVQALHTPGHVGNHVCYLLRQENMIFAGDHMMNGSTVVIIPPSGDMGDYLDSLALMKACNPNVVAPGHGEPIADATAEIDRLIAHRLAREEKIYSVLKNAGQISLQALVPLVYDDVDAALHSVARYSLLAHLLHLEKCQRIKKAVDHSAIEEQEWLCLTSYITFYGAKLWTRQNTT